MSKRIWQHPEVPADESGVVAWRSAAELDKAPAFRARLEREFPEGSGELSEEDREVSRRNFMKLMGASSALSGLALVACRRPEAYILPYKKAPEWVIPGKPLYYASARPRAEGAVPLVVTTYEGRPTKLEPNREHPDSAGTDALTQASVLNLYDPNRSREFLNFGAKTSRASFAAALGKIAKTGGKIGILVGDDDSPTRQRLLGEVAKKYAGAKFYSYEALRSASRKAAYTAAFGSEGAEVVTDFAKADRVLSLDADFLGNDPQGRSTAFAARRQGGGDDYKHDIDAGKMNRLYAVETAFSLTGGMADHRLRVAPSRVLLVAVEIAKAIAAKTNDANLTAAVAGVAVADAEKKAIVEGSDKGAKDFDAWVEACADDLVAHKGKAAVLAGSLHSEGLHSLAVGMNAALDAYGEGKPRTAVKTGRESSGSIDELAADLDSGAIETIFLIGPSNPVYDTPSDLRFGRILNKAKTSIHLGLRTDATALACTWHVPAAHYLESWGDARTASGSYALVQPMILPLYGGVTDLELLAHLIAWTDVDWAKVEAGETPAPTLHSGEGPEGEPSPGLPAVRATFAELFGEGDDPWKEAQRNGYAEASYETLAVSAGFSGAKVKAAVAKSVVPAAPSAEKLEVSFVADASVWDGRYIDNGWLQEAPDPISKLSWDNAAYVSPRTAKELGVYKREAELENPRAKKPEIDEGKNAKAPVAVIQIGERELSIPVLVAFGHADNCITIPVGYGQGADDGRSGAVAISPEQQFRDVGDVGLNSGFNANVLRSAKAPHFAGGATVESSKKKYPVALVQEHNAMNGRALAREVSTQEQKGKSFEEQVASVAKQGKTDSHAPENISLYKREGSKAWEKDPDKVADLISDKIHQWGMAIDLNTCIGCNACMVACQAENNIPIVGKEQVAMGREMHWIRMDRYYAAITKVENKETHKKESTPQWVQDNPEMVPQPVACSQCENAPCETVCPVNATVHTEEGLNTMAYNRCIGTRYCANNCPYKVRRFNYFDYNKRNPLLDHNLYKGPLGETKVGDATHLQRNPNVSVRMRGVMEKCTYCVQRLESAKIKQKQIGTAKALESGKHSTKVPVSHEDLRIKTDSVKVACQEACPTDAIAFGNLLDKQGHVYRAKWKGEKQEHGKTVKIANPRNYTLLNYIGALPRTTYLARVKNPNPAMPDAKFRGLATINIA